MNLSIRSRISLAQLLVFIGYHSVGILFEKHGIALYAPTTMEEAKAVLAEIQPRQLASLLEEVVRMKRTLRSYADPEYVFDERWDDFERCLAMDNYRIEDGRIVAIDPAIEGAVGLEDDLTSELRHSGLPRADEAIRLLDSSADAYRKTPPAYNACLTDARVALETIAKDIAEQRVKRHPGAFDPTSWGSVLGYLRTSGLITVKEHAVLAGVYGFVSEGAHRPVGPCEEEMTLLGRSLAVGMAYFLIRVYKKQP